MIRVGVAGFGMGGRVFHCPLISSVEGLELAGVLERSSDNAAERYPDITTYRSLDEMMADSSLDLFVVTTPSGTHFDIARQLLQAGKNVVIDKPMAASSAHIAELIRMAAERELLLAPFHNRRWDSDFQTLQKVMYEGSLGRVISLESRFDRWRPHKPKDRLWKEDTAQGGGTLLDLGTHIADQILVLFGKPESIAADVRSEREWASASDAFTIRLRYAEFTVTMGANSLSMPAGPRYHLRATKGNYWKFGVDPQEAALTRVTRIDDPNWGREPEDEWGMLYLESGGSSVTRRIEPVTGDYRLYYAAVRDTLLGKRTFPISPVDAWRVARLLEWAEESSKERREIRCDWSGEPEE